MSEEQTDFKVTDRRLFNADGTPRDVEREEPITQTQEATAAPAPDTSSSSGASSAAAPSASPERPVSITGERPTASTADSRRATRAEAESFDEMDAERSLPGVDDPASFINFLMSIASNAAAALGMMEHPVTGERGLDLQLAKHWIDVLGMLQQKTQGNLSAQEQQIFEGLLSDLRMQYVSLTSAAPPTQKRGFTGRDITGGK
jgi:hypothetical protein